MAKIHLAPFDPRESFVVLRPFRCKDRDFERGDKFDRSLVTTRTLRIFYELRSIGYEKDNREIRPYPGMVREKPAKVERIPAIDKDDLAVASRPVLAAMVRRAGFPVTRSSTRADLIDQLTRIPHAAAHG